MAAAQEQDLRAVGGHLHRPRLAEREALGLGMQPGERQRLGGSRRDDDVGLFDLHGTNRRWFDDVVAGSSLDDLGVDNVVVHRRRC